MTRPTSMKKMTLTRTANTSSWLRKSNCVEASRKRGSEGRPRGALSKSRGLRLLPSPPCANRAAALANTLSARWWPSHFGVRPPSAYPWNSNFGEFPFRGCMKSGSRRVFRYSSTHEKVLPDGFIRCRMELHRASFAHPHRTWTAEDPQSPRDPERRLLPPKERLPVATASARLPQVAHRLPLLQEMALRRYLGADQPRHP